MKNTNKLLLAAIVSSVSVSAIAQIQEDRDKPSAKKEKCYGIVKAGKNDCAAADGSHSCAGLAKNDGDGKEWVLLPAGTCERIVGGLINPKL
jgi:uncharacterized membrane protein